SGRFRELEFATSAPPVTELIDYEAFCGEEPASAEAQGTETAPDFADLTLLDVRESWEAEIVSLPGSLLVPLRSLPDVIDTLDPEADWLVYCHLGVRSQRAVELMRAHGFTKVRHLEGGIDAWAREHDPSMARY